MVRSAELGQVLQRGQDAQELVQLRVVGAEFGRERPDRAPIHLRREPGVGRQHVVEILHDEDAVPELEVELAAFEHAAVLVTEDRQQELCLECRLDRSPVDIEVARARGPGAVLEDVAPPRVRAGTDPHVIRHEVDHVTQSESGQTGNEAGVRLRSAELRIDRVVIADVVAVHAAGIGGEVGRRVAGVGPEPGKIGREVRRIVEREAGVQLEAVRAQWNVHRAPICKSFPAQLRY